VEYTAEYMPVPVSYPIRTAADLDHFTPPDPAFTSEERERFRAAIGRYKGKKAILASNRAVCGHQNGLGVGCALINGEDVWRMLHCMSSHW